MAGLELSIHYATDLQVVEYYPDLNYIQLSVKSAGSTDRAAISLFGINPVAAHRIVAALEHDVRNPAYHMPEEFSRKTVRDIEEMGEYAPD